MAQPWARIAGGAVGYYMDKQEAKLRQQMEGTGVEVVRRGDNITLDMPGGVTFAFNSSDLNSAVLSRPRQGGGHARRVQQDGDRGGGPHRQRRQRAATTSSCPSSAATSVAAYLVSRGVDRRRMVTVGAGKDHPVASNETEEGRAQNRRVEITIVPVTQENVQKAKSG